MQLQAPPHLLKYNMEHWSALLCQSQIGHWFLSIQHWWQPTGREVNLDTVPHKSYWTAFWTILSFFSAVITEFPPFLLILRQCFVYLQPLIYKLWAVQTECFPPLGSIRLFLFFPIILIISDPIWFILWLFRQDHTPRLGTTVLKEHKWLNTHRER